MDPLESDHEASIIIVALSQRDTYADTVSFFDPRGVSLPASSTSYFPPKLHVALRPSNATCNHVRVLMKHHTKTKRRRRRPLTPLNTTNYYLSTPWRATSNTKFSSPVAVFLIHDSGNSNHEILPHRRSHRRIILHRRHNIGIHPHHGHGQFLRPTLSYLHMGRVSRWWRGRYTRRLSTSHSHFPR